ncbi:kynureninase [Fodinicurvata sp. EGI_FJ10296]|uniref:kynureninase n=1 Tax=Fodinicurvata sp. EGI_FJ10296 TaxID=3231908 RepID=UPI0034559BE2
MIERLMTPSTTPDIRDSDDPLAPYRERFDLPEGVIYLDGNSLGPLPRGVSDRVAATVADQWGTSLIRGWNDHAWMDLPTTVGDKIARLIGAPAGSVVAGDSTSINVFKALSAALRLRPGRTTILSDTGNFPTDLYVAQELAALLGSGYQLETVTPDAVESRIDADVAVVMLTEVDYRTGRRHDMKALTRAAHAAGALIIWDLAHSAGAFPVHLQDCGADFAVGCGYKYLNGGPGALAFLFVAPEHQAHLRPAIAGWMGHDAPFAFDPDYRPAPDIRRMQVGTPPILAMAALDAALDVFADVDMEAVRRKSVALCNLFIDEVERRCPQLELVTPREADRRGSQVSFRTPEGYAMMQALIAHGVIGDFRAPDIMRFGFTPLYLRYHDVIAAAEMLERVVNERLWDQEQFRHRRKVT